MGRGTPRLGHGGRLGEASGPSRLRVHAPADPRRRLSARLHRSDLGPGRRAIQLRQRLGAVLLSGRAVRPGRSWAGGARPRDEPARLARRNDRRRKHLPAMVPTDRRSDPPGGVDREGHRFPPGDPAAAGACREVSGVELVATIYYNRGVDLLAKKEFAQAAAANAKIAASGPVERDRSRKSACHAQQLGDRRGQFGALRRGGGPAQRRHSIWTRPSPASRSTTCTFTGNGSTPSVGRGAIDEALARPEPRRPSSVPMNPGSPKPSPTSIVARARQGRRTQDLGVSLPLEIAKRCETIGPPTCTTRTEVALAGDSGFAPFLGRDVAYTPRSEPRTLSHHVRVQGAAVSVIRRFSFCQRCNRSAMFRV